MRKRWSDEELNLLKDLYPNNDINELIPYFDNYSKASIFRQALRLGLKKTFEQKNKSLKAVKFGKAWHSDEVDLLRKLYKEEGLSLEEIAQKLGRSVTSAMGMKQRLKLRKSHSLPTPTIPESLTKSQSMTWEYLAGIIDGEGCFTVQRQHDARRQPPIHFRPLLQISNTNQLLIESIRYFLYNHLDTYKNFHYQPQVHYNEKSRISNQKPVYTIIIQRQILLKEVINHVLPYLIIKEKHARLILGFLDSGGKEPAFDLKIEIGSLNKKGYPLECSADS